jgi:hypothetical protein
MHKVWEESYILIHLVDLSVCLSQPVHSDSLIVSARSILQPLNDRNDVSKKRQDVKKLPLIRLVIYPSVIRPVRHIILLLRVWHYNFLLGWGWWEVGGEVFFFKLYLVWRVDNELFMQVLFGREERIYFPFSQWEGPRCLAFIPFKFGGWKGFYFHFSLFPNVFSQCSL